jgi:hypothetical protein
VYDQEWHDVIFTIESDHPKLKNAMIDELVCSLRRTPRRRTVISGSPPLSHFSVTGKSRYTIDLAQQVKEFASIPPFSHNHGAWDLVKDAAGLSWMEAMTLDHAEAMTGNYYTKDVEVAGKLIVHYGTSACVGLRIQGARRGCYGGFIKAKWEYSCISMADCPSCCQRSLARGLNDSMC